MRTCSFSLRENEQVEGQTWRFISHYFWLWNTNRHKVTPGLPPRRKQCFCPLKISLFKTGKKGGGVRYQYFQATLKKPVWEVG